MDDHIYIYIYIYIYIIFHEHNSYVTFHELLGYESRYQDYDGFIHEFRGYQCSR